MIAGIRPAQAGEPVVGKTYDKSNYQEIDEYLIKPLKIYLEGKEFIITVSRLDYEPKQYQPYKELSAKNEGKYAFDSDGMLIEKSTGKIPDYVEGNPFPVINPKHPQVAQQLMENFAFSARYRTGSGSQAAEGNWVGQGGLERSIVSSGAYLYYQNRIGTQGRIENPNNFLQLTVTGVFEPYDLRGTTSMSWTYNDNREDSALAYIPMLRRVRRTSAPARLRGWPNPLRNYCWNWGRRSMPLT